MKKECKQCKKEFELKDELDLFCSQGCKEEALAELFKKNFILVPVIASVLVGTFTGVRYIVNLTDTINDNKTQIVNLKRDLKVAEDKITDQNTRLTSAESTWQMAENLYRQLADQVREHSYDIKDLNR